MDAKVESKRLRESLVGVDKLKCCAFLRLLTPLEDYGRLCVPGTSQAMTTVVETVKEMILHVMQKNTSGQEKATLGESSQQMLNMLVILPTQRNAIEYRTRGQSENSLWHDHHWGRLTASNFGSIV